MSNAQEAVKTRHKETSLIFPVLALVVLFLWGSSQTLPVVIAINLLALIGILSSAFSVVRHADVLAHRLGEPYGSLILSLSVVILEVSLISALMATGDAAPTLMRDTLYSIIMIVTGGLVGFSLLLGAYHFTAPAPGGTGAIDCMKLTLADAGIAPEQVDHINAHGTGTHMNDACETAAIHAVFGEHAKQLTVVSTKSMTGHLLGGAGGIEAVFTALALRDQFAPPTIHYEQPDPECDLDYVPNVGRAQNMTYALSNSLGFGGHNACIALRRWEG